MRGEGLCDGMWSVGVRSEDDGKVRVALGQLGKLHQPNIH